MLSRFTLPGFGSLMPSRQTSFSLEEIDNAVSQIKLLGKRSNGGTDEASMKDIESIISLMSTYADSLSVQRVACHALSNLAMQVMSARWIVQKQGAALVLKAVDNFCNDHKLCWLASSAIWNLARPPANRASIGKAGVTAMLKILSLHGARERVVNTAIGALSNLALLDALKDFVAQPENLRQIIAVLMHSAQSGHTAVMTSGAGLLANIAVSDDYAAELVRLDGLCIILPLLQWQKSDETLFRNTCAALNNLVTADGFLKSFLATRGLEVVLEFLDKHSSDTYDGLLENCLATIDADGSVKTTSMHYACFHGARDVFHELYSKDSDSDLDANDGRNMTCLDYAISSGHVDVVEMLAKYGAKSHSQTVSDEMRDALAKGAATLKQTRTDTYEAMADTLASFPTDLCKHMLTYQHNLDLLKAVEE